MDWSCLGYILECFWLVRRFVRLTRLVRNASLDSLRRLGASFIRVWHLLDKLSGQWLHNLLVNLPLR